MATRKIDFPDHTADDFDPDQVFEADNGLKYTWNGYGWELVEGGIAMPDTSIYVTHDELEADQERQDDLWAIDQKRQDDEFAVDQDRQDQELEDYKQEVQLDQDRQDAEIDEIKIDINKSEDPVDGSVSYRFVTHPEFTADQNRQEQELEDYKQEVQADQDRQDQKLQDEIDARVERDALHDAEIDTLEFKLDALLGLTFRGTYEFKHEADCDAAYLACMTAAGSDLNAQQACTRDYASCEQDKVLPGYFEAIDPDDQFDHLEQIIIAKSDSSGVEVDWAGVLNAGDYLEVDHVFAGSLDKTNYGLYRITEEPEVTTNAHGQEVYTMKLQFLQGDGVMNEGEKYEIRGITAAEGVNPEELGDFLTKDQAALTYLPLSGGTLTGTLNMDGAAVVKTRHLDSGNDSDLQIKRYGQRRILVGTDAVIFDKIPQCGTNPSADNDLCRKKWVDDNKSTKGHTHSNYASSTHNHDSTYSKTGHTHNYASSSHNHGSDYIKSKNSQTIKIYQSGSVFYIE